MFTERVDITGEFEVLSPLHVGSGGFVEQCPVLDAVAAGKNKLGLVHGNGCRVHGHRAQVFNARQAAGNACG